MASCAVLIEAGMAARRAETMISETLIPVSAEWILMPRRTSSGQSNWKRGRWGVVAMTTSVAQDDLSNKALPPDCQHVHST
jgi:hypothetical protein